MENGILDFYLPDGNYYKTMDECSWLIQVADNNTISLEFVDVDVSF